MAETAIHLGMHLEPTFPKRRNRRHQTTLLGAAFALQFACGGKIAPFEGDIDPAGDRGDVGNTDPPKENSDNSALAPDPPQRSADSTQEGTGNSPQEGPRESATDTCAVLTNGALPTTCFGRCVDLQSDEDHCGACDRACAGTLCERGVCQ